jgi:rhodanese-related sulfurtransferase
MRGLPEPFLLCSGPGGFRRALPSFGARQMAYLSMYIPAEALAERHREIPRHREIVLFCTCPDEITSAKEALRLRARGMRPVRPLEGGLTAWRDAGYPVASMGPAVAPEQRILNAA